MADIESSLRYVLKFGALGNGGSCHSPLRYLSTSIEQVRIKALQQDALRRTAQGANGENDPAQEESAKNATQEAQQNAQALRDFEAHLSPSEQEYYLTEATKDNSTSGFAPPLSILRKLAAIKWVQSRIRGTG